jgi:hypothetical protein
LVSAKAREGVVRFHKDPSFEKIWNFGPPLDASIFSDTNRIYIESWSGLSNNFWTDAELKDGGKIEATEYWMPIHVTETSPDGIRKQVEEKIKASFSR